MNLGSYYSVAETGAPLRCEDCFDLRVLTVVGKVMQADDVGMLAYIAELQLCLNTHSATKSPRTTRTRTQQTQRLNPRARASIYIHHPPALQKAEMQGYGVEHARDHIAPSFTRTTVQCNDAGG